VFYVVLLPKSFIEVPLLIEGDGVYGADCQEAGGSFLIITALPLQTHDIHY
jgi:hypothetical protein